MAIGGIGTAAVSWGGSQVNAVTDSGKQTLSTTSSIVSSGLANPIIIFGGVILIILMSAMWIPYHQVVLGGLIQPVYTDLVRPFAREIAVPVLAAADKPYQQVVAWLNFGQTFIRKVGFDALLIPLRCRYLGSFAHTTLDALVPVARGLALAVRMAINALFGKAPALKSPAIAVGLVFDSLGDVADGLSSVVGCYCAFLSYYLDLVTLFFTNSNIQCTVANILGIVLEVVSSTIKAAVELLRYAASVVQWMVCRIFSVTSCEKDEFPFPDGMKVPSAPSQQSR